MVLKPQAQLVIGVAFARVGILPGDQSGSGERIFNLSVGQSHLAEHRKSFIEAKYADCVAIQVFYLKYCRAMFPPVPWSP